MKNIKSSSKQLPDQAEFSHLNSAGEANMVDVTEKADTARSATAEAIVILSPHVLEKVLQQGISKGDLFATARIAGIQGAKKCADLIPLCHPLPLSKVSIDIEPFETPHKAGLKIVATCKTTGKTGVEMEALTAASVASLTVYDMCKALDKGIVIERVQLLEKYGGKSGPWLRSNIEALHD